MAFEHYDKCSLLLPMDGANNGTVFDDWSLSPKTVGRAGNPLPITSTTQSKYYGSSGFFGANASGQQQSRFNLTSIAFSGEFTIACWVKIPHSGDMGVIYDSRINSEFTGYNSLSDANFVFYVREATKKLAFLYNASGPVNLESVTAFPDDVFTHVALTRDSSNVVRIFIDGVLEASATVSNNFSDIYACIGANPGTTVTPSKYYNDLIIVDGAALWTASFTPPARLIGELSNASAANPVEDESGTPVERRIFAVPRCYPTRMFTSVSDVNGDFTLRAPATECSVFAIHEGSPIKNDLIQRVIPV